MSPSASSPAEKCPDYATKPLNPDGTWNEAWWRFFAAIAAQFNGNDPPSFPVDIAGVLGAAVGFQPELPVSSAALDIAAAALAIPAPVTRGGGAYDLSLSALALAEPPNRPPPPEIIYCTQSTFPILANITPCLIIVTDYGHAIYWDGVAPVFVDGGNCFIALFDIDPTAPKWHLLDGAANVPYLKEDGTLGMYTVEDATVAFYLKAGLTNSGPNAAVAPAFAGTPAVLTGTVSQPTFTGTPLGGHQHEMPMQAVSSTLQRFLGAVFGTGTSRAAQGQVALTANATSAPVALSEDVSAGTPAGTVSQPALTMNSYTPAGTVAATAEPRNLVRRPWFRQ